MIADDSEVILVATVNVPSEPIQPKEVIIKDYSENEGILLVLYNAGIIDQPHRTTEQGFPVCMLRDYEGRPFHVWTSPHSPTPRHLGKITDVELSSISSNIQSLLSPSKLKTDDERIGNHDQALEIARTFDFANVDDFREAVERHVLIRKRQNIDLVESR
jgi:hypothetical protein